MLRVFATASYAFVLAALSSQLTSQLSAEEYLNGIQWGKPPIVKPGEKCGDAPADATMLFNGKDLSNWTNGDKWSVEGGVIISGKGAMTSQEEFGDCQLHIEWSTPTPAVGSGQGRGNSGVFMMGIYEIQVLDSYDNETYADGQAGAVYKQTPPMVNVTRPPGEWNVYDIFWTAPKFNEDGSLETPAYVTLVHNGVLLLNHFALLGDTPFSRPPQYNEHPAVGPLMLQDHNNPVRFRNIWARPLVPVTREQVREPFLRDGDQETPVENKQRLTEIAGTDLDRSAGPRFCYPEEDSANYLWLSSSECQTTIMQANCSADRPKSTVFLFRSRVRTCAQSYRMTRE